MICEKCFGDKFLSDQIKSLSSQTIESCIHCNAQNVIAIDATHVQDIISSILNIYDISDEHEAKHLTHYLREDWALLTNISDDSCEKIIDEVFGDNFSTKKFKSKQEENNRSLLWNDFQDELKHKNRFFPQIKLEQEDLADLFSFLILKDHPKEFYRARISEGKATFPIDKMGKPPEKYVKNGRANPVGISYLYSASDFNTAICEVRPHVGDFVTIAKFVTTNNLNLLDLRNPRKTISPFSINEEDLLRMLNEIGYLCKLGEKLSKPILPKEADLEYLASQYLCEMIKHLKYDGVVYKSSVGEGFNIAFFDDSKLIAVPETTLYSISNLKYTAVPSAAD